MLEENRERERVGLATNIEVLQSEASLATRREAIITADAMIENSQDTLFRRMGSTEYPEGLIAVNPLPDFSGEPMGSRSSLTTILANNPCLPQSTTQCPDRGTRRKIKPQFYLSPS